MFSDPLYSWLNISAGVVIFGVVLEGFSVLHNIRTFRAVWRQEGWQSAFATLKLKWHLIVERVGFMVLVIGLTNELLAQSRIETRDAHDRLELQRVKAVAEWRKFSDEQKAAIKQALAKVPPHRITLAFFAGDPESMVYAGQLGNLLQGAGWQIHTSARVYGRMLQFGISVNGPDDPTVQAALSVLHSAKGLDLHRNISWPAPDRQYDDNTVPDGPEVILVGIKDSYGVLSPMMRGEF